MKTDIPISVVILTRNEAASIIRCLDSISFSDDILIFDSSTDETVSIINYHTGSNNIRIFSVPVISDFARVRNEALQKAKHDWILFVDADEEVSNDLADEIKQAIQAENIQGYLIKRNDYFLGRWLKHGETGAIAHLKLGKKSAGNWKRSVHEVWDIQGSVATLTHPLFHYPHPTIAEFLEHINRWTTLDAQEFFKEGKRSSWWKIIAYPKAKFIQNYLVKQGFLDGMPGFIMALMMSFHSFLTRAKLYQLQQGEKEEFED